MAVDRSREGSSVMTLKPCAAMADEPGWGHFVRFAKENGLHSLGAVSPLLPNGWNAAERWIIWQRLAHLMTGTQHPNQLDEYFRQNCVFSQLIEYKHLLGPVWPRLARRWAFHHGSFYFARATVRSCPECIKEDVGKHGFAWYRQGHQLPGVDWCWLHSASLYEVETHVNIVRSRSSWTMLRLPTKQTGRARIPPFVRRYLRVLEWLRQPQNHLAWSAAHAVLSGLLPVSKTLTDGWMQTDERIAAAAPRDWYAGHYDFRVMRSRHLNCPAESQSPVLALRAAFLARSEADLNQLFAKIDDALEAQKGSAL